MGVYFSLLKEFSLFYCFHFLSIFNFVTSSHKAVVMEIFLCSFWSHHQVAVYCPCVVIGAFCHMLTNSWCQNWCILHLTKVIILQRHSTWPQTCFTVLQQKLTHRTCIFHNFNTDSFYSLQHIHWIMWKK